jgi:O-antigen/teichoic acid export membrane protein
VLWSSTGTVAQFISSVVVMVILARLLTPTDFGVVTAATLVVSFAQVFTRLGITQAIIQRPDLAPIHIRTGFTYSVASGLILTAVIWLLTPLIADFFRIEAMIPVLRALTAVFLLRGLSAVAESIMQREMRFRPLANIQVISYVLGYGVTGIILAWVGWGVWALVYAQLAQTVIETILFIYWGRHDIRPALNQSALKELMSIGGGVTLSKLANQVAVQGDNLIIGRTLGAELLGLYSRAYRLMALPANLFGDAVELVSFPAMAKVQDDKVRLARAFCRSVTLTAVLAFPVMVISLLVAPEIIHVFLGPQWVGTIEPFQILAFGLYFRLGYKINGSLAKARGEVYELARLKIFYAVTILLGAWVGHFWGLSGVAAAVVLALGLHFFLLLRLSLQQLEIPWSTFLLVYKPALYSSALIGLAVGLVIQLLRFWHVAPILILFIAGTLFLGILGLSIWFVPKWFSTPYLVWWLQIIAETLHRFLGKWQSAHAR